MPEEIPEAEEEEEEEGVEQGETQPHPPEDVGPSQGTDDGESPNPEVRRSERGRIPSKRYPESEYSLLTEDGEPENFQEAISHKDKEKWLFAMQEEMESLQKNHTYEIINLPQGKKTLKNKWVFKLKKDSRGKVVKHKA